MVDREALAEAQEANDVVRAEEILRDAFLTDVRPLVSEAYRRSGGAIRPIAAYRAEGVRAKLIQQRGKHSVSTGL